MAILSGVGHFIFGIVLRFVRIAVIPAQFSMVTLLSVFVVVDNWMTDFPSSFVRQLPVTVVITSTFMTCMAGVCSADHSWRISKDLSLLFVLPSS